MSVRQYSRFRLKGLTPEYGAKHSLFPLNCAISLSDTLTTPLEERTRHI
ncbi:hypothetical protein GGR93_002480 [Sulfitobacter noctilucicola]|uniref:Uncharacterized protein n=1 Tax=Sulfitobacter noctilucicola TaxID=1342301 RepID=A0A7W6MAK0_9RHOB|nr:hypothetical protein [Sulfitobacter noctilucicola]